MYGHSYLLGQLPLVVGHQHLEVLSQSFEVTKKFVADHQNARQQFLLRSAVDLHYFCGDGVPHAALVNTAAIG